MDKGSEFRSKEFEAFYDENGIRHQLTAPYTLQHNRVERRNQIVMSLVRSMLKEKNLPLELWAEVVNTTVYVINKSSTKSFVGMTLYKKLSSQKPNIEHLRVLRSLAYVKNVSRHLKKLEDRSQPAIFISYEIGTKAYR